MLPINMSRKTARILMMTVFVIALVNVVIVSLLSSSSASSDKPIGDTNDKVAVRGANGHGRDKLTGEEGFDLSGNALFREDKLIGDSNETDWRFKRNKPISKKELKSFMQTSRHRGPIRCGHKSTFVVTFVITSPYSISRRNAIRESWGKTIRVEKRNVQTIFVMGKHPDSWNHGGVISLEKEIEKYHDILKGRFKLEKETRNSLKVLLGLQWIRESCRHASYVLVVEDTMFVNYRRLVKALKYRESQDEKNVTLWIGNVQTNQKPIHDITSSHFISERLFNESVYPPYCSSAAGYVLSMAAVRDLYNAALTRTLLPIMDLFTGIVARDKNWTLIHNSDLFTTTRVRSKICAADRVATAVAPDNPDLMIATWKHLDNFTELRDCMDPDLDLVLPQDINNAPYLDRMLRMRYDHPHICFSSRKRQRKVFMVVFINSQPDHQDMRNAIRRTWGKNQEVDGEAIKLLFILGKQYPETQQTKFALRAENAKFGDIVQAEFIDSFQNLTLKVILGLKWLSVNCPHAKYLYKGDEDMFVNFNNIVAYLKKLRDRGEATENFFMGSRIFGNRRFSPEKEGDEYFKKFHVSDKLYRGHYYPPYCSGSGYILSSDTVPKMYREALRTPIISVADAFQGILAKRIGVDVIGNRGFKTWGGKLDACALRANDTMNVHGIGKTPKQLFSIWDAYTDNKIKCKGIWG